MKVLVVGNGGREHALAWALAKTADVIGTPANPGIARLGKCFDVAVDDLDGIVKLSKDQTADLVVDYAKRTGQDTFYLWGAEWWYWMKVKHNQPEIWEEAKKL